jgi:hypothetical protein
MSASPVSAVTLRALVGQPLDDPRTRDMVLATANAIAERQGVKVLKIKTTPESITVTLEIDRIAAMGFAAELRRLTTRWYTQKFSAATLWGEAQRDDHDAGEQWKRA